MELRTMRYFLAVAREENMTRAAELLHVTQPTLSKQLKALKDDQRAEKNLPEPALPYHQRRYRTGDGKA